MKYWFWALALTTLGISNAKADYVILRVILTGDEGPTTQPGGMMGVPPGGMMGVPPGGMMGLPMPPGGMRGFPMPPGGMMGLPMPPGAMLGNRGGFPSPPGGMMGLPPGAMLGNRGGFPSPPGGMMGLPMPPGGFGGVPPMGFGGVPPMGMTGGGTQQPQVKVSPDEYVMAVIDIKDNSFQAIPSNWIYHREKIGVPGHFTFKSKHGTTYVNINQGDIHVDFMHIPGPAKQLEAKRKAMKDPSAEKYLELAEWCLSVGLPEDANKIIANVAASYGTSPTLKPHVKAVIEAYGKVKNIIDANVEAKAKAEQWKTRLRLGALTESKHYAIAHAESAIAQESANARLEYLENNLKTFYLWFALRGKALPGPTEKLPAVIVSESREFRSYRDTFEATNVVDDGFFARRENLAVFALHRLDKASVNFQQTVGQVYKKMNPDDLFKPTLPDLKVNPNAPKFDELARASMLATVDKALREEAEIAAASHEGTKQLFAETGLLPRNILVPEWLRFGTAALFEMPKGPFPGEKSQVKVAFYPGGGGPSWAYMRYYEEMKEDNLLGNPGNVFLSTVLDKDFSAANEMAKRLLDQKRRGEEGDSKDTPAEVLAQRARTLSWALVYYLAKDKFPEFEVFLQELAKMPRDAELDSIAVAKALATAFRLHSAALDSDYFDITKFKHIGNEWMQFMARQQSPTRNLKLDTLKTSVGSGMGTGTGFPGGPMGPGGPGGFPGGPGGPGGFPGGPMGPGGPGGFPGGGPGRPPGR